MSMAIGGLVSGLKTEELITQLMQVEAVPQTQLKTQSSRASSLITALQTLNASIAALGTLATATGKPGSTDLFAPSSSAPSVTAKAGAGASAGRISFDVTAVAQSQVSVTAASTAWPDDPPTLTFRDAAGVTKQVTAASISMADVASAINAAGVGVTATRVASGTDAQGVPQYRLQLTAAASGAGGAFSVFRGTPEQVAAGEATDLLTLSGAATVTTASDATVVLWQGTAAQQTITSATNTFTDLLPGVTVTVGKPETSVTVTLTKDTAAVTAMAKNLVSTLTGTLAMLDSGSTSRGADGTAKGGIFTGSAAVRDARDRLQSALSQPIAGRSPGEIGVTVTRSGSFTFDEAKFSAALAADPARTEQTLRALAERVAGTATALSDTREGTITGAIKGQQSTVSDLQDQIQNWDVRLASRRTTLERTYAQLEVQLQNLQSQSSWLTSQLAGLTPSTGNT